MSAKKEFSKLAEELGVRLSAKHQKLVTAESCTGGWLSQVITSVSGSSMWFDRGYVVYSNEAKHELLKISNDMLEKHGAVSEEVARALAENALQRSAADIAIAITGIAGPTGGIADKPVGTVWFGLASNIAETKTFLQNFQGDRQSIRGQAVEFALEKLISALI